MNDIERLQELMEQAKYHDDDTVTVPIEVFEIIARLARMTERMCIEQANRSIRQADEAIKNMMREQAEFEWKQNLERMKEEG